MLVTWGAEGFQAMNIQMTIGGTTLLRKLNLDLPYLSILSIPFPTETIQKYHEATTSRHRCQELTEVTRKICLFFDFMSEMRTLQQGLARPTSGAVNAHTRTSHRRVIFFPHDGEWLDLGYSATLRQRGKITFSREIVLWGSTTFGWTHIASGLFFSSSPLAIGSSISIVTSVLNCFSVLARMYYDGKSFRNTPLCSYNSWRGSTCGPEQINGSPAAELYLVPMDLEQATMEEHIFPSQTLLSFGIS